MAAAKRKPTPADQRDTSQALTLSRRVLEMNRGEVLAGRSLLVGLIEILETMDARTGRRDPTKRTARKRSADG